jgi:uncharacterized protein (TIGR03437 family)
MRLLPVVVLLTFLTSRFAFGQANPSYPVGEDPVGIAFDGVNIWVTNFGDSTVTKLLASTGARLGTYPTGAGPYAAAFDGTNIWVSNLDGNSVTKLLASTGVLLGTYPVGLSPRDVAFDGANIWVPNVFSSNVTKLLASTGTTVGTYAAGGPVRVAFDGVNIWVVQGDNSVAKLLASTGAAVGTYTVGPNPAGITFDGTNIWVTNYNGRSVTKLLASTGATVGTYPAGENPYSLAFDGANIWVVNQSSNSVTKLAASTGAMVSTYTVGSVPEGVVFDGANIWVVNSGDNSVTKISDANPKAPYILPAGIVPLDSTTSTIQPGEWISIFGGNLAGGTAVWSGNFPTSLGGTSVQINGKATYLSFVSPGQINLQAPDDTATGAVLVEIVSPVGSTTSTVTLGKFGPSFSLLDTKHVAGIILRANGSGAYSGGAYDILGPTGSSLGYPTVAAKAGDSVELFGVGFGPTVPAIPAGQPFSGAVPTEYAVQLTINGTAVTPFFAGMSSAGLYQLNLTVPPGLGTGDQALVAIVGGVQTQSGVVVSLQ